MLVHLLPHRPYMSELSESDVTGLWSGHPVQHPHVSPVDSYLRKKKVNLLIKDFASRSPGETIKDDNCLIAIIEETVQIPCSLDTYEPLKREDISVGWETYEGLIVHTFKKGKDYLENQDSKFKGRTQLFLPELPRGNFTLRLSDVSLTDEGEYVCRYYRIGEKSSSNLSHQCLQVAGRYSDPIVHGPASPVLKDSEVNFTCKSTGGYPKPKIQWSVNKEPFQDSSRVDTRLSKDSRERYNVTSILTVNMTEKVTVSCSVENEKLRDKRASPETECEFILCVIIKMTCQKMRSHAEKKILLTKSTPNLSFVFIVIYSNVLNIVEFK
ncbi:ICOSL protein, partial [Polypterus senegalus]